MVASSDASSCVDLSIVICQSSWPIKMSQPWQYNDFSHVTQSSSEIRKLEIEDQPDGTRGFHFHDLAKI